jgi:hypothetical protein
MPAVPDAGVRLVQRPDSFTDHRLAVLATDGGWDGRRRGRTEAPPESE